MYVPGRTNNIYIASVKTALRLSLKVFSANIIKCLMLNKKKPKSKNKKKNKLMFTCVYFFKSTSIYFTQS